MHHPGFTLFELLVTLTIAAILGVLAIPTMTNFVAATQSAAALNQMIGAVQFARSAAVTTRQTVTLCPGPKQGCGKRNQWQQGANIFIDKDQNGKQNSDEQLLKRLPGIRNGQLYWRSFRNRGYLQFRSTGLTNWQNGNFLYCPTSRNPTHARMIILNAQGRVRKSPDTDGDGIAENAAGENIICPVR